MTAKTQILALNIGSTKIQAQLIELSENTPPKVLSTGTSPATGTDRGKITTPKDFATAIDRAIKRAEWETSEKTKDIIITIPSYKLTYRANTALITPKTPESITKSDQQTLLNKAQNIIKTPEEILLHNLPKHYKINGQLTESPIGKKGTHFEIETTSILTEKTNLGLIITTIEKLGYNLIASIADPIATTAPLLNPNTKQLIIDIGGRYTKLSYFKNAKLQTLRTIPVGGDTITTDIATCIKTSFPESERIKVIHGTTQSPDTQRTISVSTEDGRREVPLKLLTDIISARVEELITLIQKAFIKELQSTDTIILTGGSSKLTALKETLETHLKKPIQSKEENTALGAILHAIGTGTLITPKPKEKSSFLSRIFSK